MKKHLKFQTLLGLVVIVSMLLAAVPMGTAKAANLSFQGGTWSGETNVGVTGRETVVYDGSLYHMWYGSADEKSLYHVTSADPANFTSTPSAVTINDWQTGDEVASSAIVRDNGVFYMVKYSAGTNQRFSIYTSMDGNSWIAKGQVFDIAQLPTAPAGTQWNKIDAPSLFKEADGSYKLFFQAKTQDTATGKIYTYTIYFAIATESLSMIADGNADNDFIQPTVALSPSQVTNLNTSLLQVMHPWVVKAGDSYYMWFSAYFTGTEQTLGMATSPDGYTWTASADNPIFFTTYAAEPSVIKVGNTWHMWYNTSAGIMHRSMVDTEEVKVVIDPTKVQRGRIFTATVLGTSHDLNGVEVHMNFDASRLQVVDADLTTDGTQIALGTGLANYYVASNSADNSAGTIDFVYAQQERVPVTGTNLVLATITFEAKPDALEGAANVGFTSATFAGNAFTVASTGMGDLTATSDTIDILADTEIHGHITLQGRPTANSNHVGTVVTLTKAGATVGTDTTEADAQYDFVGLDAGASYSFTAHKDGYLNVTWAAQTLDAKSYIIPTVMLLGGDAFVDAYNTINVNDLSAIASVFSTNGSSFTDINGDGTVNILDLSMAGANYNKTAQTITPW